MNDKQSWRVMMETRFEDRKKIQTPTLVATIVGLHIVAVGSIVFIQGCETARPMPEPPPAPVMPEDAAVTDPVPPVTPRPEPVFQPPVTREPRPETVRPEDAKTYTVRSGDSLSRIASRHGVEMTEIMALNNIANPDRIEVDQVLLLPAHARVRSDAPAARPAATPPPSNGDTYTVRSGDALSRIAVRHGVSLEDLMAANNITNPDRIIEGQRLVIPAGGTAPTPERTTSEPAPRAPTPRATFLPADEADAPEIEEDAEPEEEVTPSAPSASTLGGETESFVYTVRPGDTLEGLARDYSVLVEDIRALNNLQPNQQLRPGQSIEIPGMSL